MGPALRVDGPHSTPGPPLVSGTLARVAGVRKAPGDRSPSEGLGRPSDGARAATQLRVSERAMTALAARWKPVTTASRVSCRSRETVCSIWAACSGDCPEARAARR